jgi:arylsulfatase A-like enzyme
MILAVPLHLARQSFTGEITMKTLALLLLPLLAVPVLATAIAGEKPNVLFIAVDDLRPELGCYGKQFIQSPNIDALARSGVRFTRAYCQQAVCGATRNSLLTGLRPDTTGIYGNTTSFRQVFPDLVALPEHFKNNGYQSIGLGKIFHQNDARSWSEPWIAAPGMVWLRPENIAAQNRRREEALAKGLSGTQLGRVARGPAAEWADLPDNAYPEGAMTDTAIETLRRIKDRPFFLAVGFIRPHLPFNCPKKYWDLYDRSEIRLPPNGQPPQGSPEYALTSWGELRNYDRIPAKGPLSEEQALELIHGYRACVSYVDTLIGRLLDELDRLDLDEKTIVILWGDHGWKLGEYGAWCKHTNFELDTHVPMIVRAPGARGNGRACDGLVEFLDIYPTLCDLAGLPLPEHLQGTSFVPLLNDPDRPGKDVAISQYPRGNVMGYSMRSDRYRFTTWLNRKDPSDVAAIELYDHQNDPGENTNVAGDPKYSETVSRLQAQLATLILRMKP